MHLIGSSHFTRVKYPVKGSDKGHLDPDPPEEEEPAEEIAVPVAPTKKRYQRQYLRPSHANRGMF